MVHTVQIRGRYPLSNFNYAAPIRLNKVQKGRTRGIHHLKLVSILSNCWRLVTVDGEGADCR